MAIENLYPNEIIAVEAEHPIAKHSQSTQVIYITTIALFFLVLVSLPFIKVDISVNSMGVLRPAVEISRIRIPVSGKVSAVLVSLNDRVTKGQTLLVLDSTVLVQKKDLQKREIAMDAAFKEDLELLLSENVFPSGIKTSFYRQSYLEYQRKMRECEIHFAKAESHYRRQVKLHDEKVIADAEFENDRFEYDNSGNNLKILKQTQRSVWQTDLLKYQREIAERETQLKLIARELKDLEIKASINGTLESLESAHVGDPVFANQEVGQISPDTTLVAELLIDPSDIGLLRDNMVTKLQITAFNYNQWGVVSGKVVQISSDIHLVNERPVFKITCSMDRTFLELQNGYKGYLKKGMTLQASFVITERSLWQLLYDNADNWLNPNINKGLENGRL
jgi:membrane fusion protein, peptide pheromone/bacteriocin exporter